MTEWMRWTDIYGQRFRLVPQDDVTPERKGKPMCTGCAFAHHGECCNRHLFFRPWPSCSVPNELREQHKGPHVWVKEKS